MSDAEPESPDTTAHHGRLHDIAEHLGEHHRRAVQRDEDAELAETADNADYDIGTDIARPLPRHGPTSYDLDTDIGIDNEPPELRS